MRTREKNIDDDTDIYDDEFSGYYFSDFKGDAENKHEVKEQEEETIASPIPENELTVILDNPKTESLMEGDELEVKLGGDYGGVYKNGQKVGDFKRALILKLFDTRIGQFVSATLFSKSAPVMARLMFSTECLPQSTRIEKVEPELY